MRLRAVAPGRSSSRLIVGCEHRSLPLSGNRPTAILKAGSERLAVVAVGIPRCDQQGAIADHLGNLMPHPLRVARVLEAGGQTLGNPEALLDRGPQQDATIRGEPTAIETDMDRLACNGWQTRQNPRTFVHGGRELCCF